MRLFNRHWEEKKMDYENDESEERERIDRRDEALSRRRGTAATSEEFLLRRQKKSILEHCKRVAVLGSGLGPEGEARIRTEKLMAFGIEIFPVTSTLKEFLGLSCFRRLGDIPGQLDIVQVYPGERVDLLTVAREAVAKRAKVVWVEEGWLTPEVKQILAEAKVQVVEHESLEREYLKHFPFTGVQDTPRKGHSTVESCMTSNPVTVKPDDPLQEAMEKMKAGHFRHLPVVDEHGRLIGMLSDRDIRLIRPSLAFVSTEQAAIQLWSTSVRQAAVFSPVTITPNTALEEAAELILRWRVGGLPVVGDKGTLLGIITYTDLLKEFIRGRGR